MNSEELKERLSSPHIDQEELLKVLHSHEQIKKYLLSKLIAQTESQIPRLTWTGSKTALIELLYALHTVEVFNNGSADIKLIASALENCFNVQLGNYYRVFQDIRLRKGSSTSFLDQLQQKLQHHINDANE